MTRARRLLSSLKGGGSAAVLVALLLGALALPTACQKSCRPGTLFLDVELDPAAAADTLDVDVTVEGGTTKRTTLPVTGRASGGVEVDFSQGYSAGKMVSLTLTARKNGSTSPVGVVSQAVTLSDSCSHVSLSFRAAADGGADVATGAGGMKGTGGVTGAGGAAGAPAIDCASHRACYTFDTTVQGWVLNDFADQGQVNLGAGTSGSAAIQFDPNDGNPTKGSLQITASFTAYHQYVDAVVDFGAPVDWSQRNVHAKAMIVSGSFPGAAFIHASTGQTSDYGAGTAVTFVPGQWTDLDIDLDTPAQLQDAALWAPTQVMELGLQFYTGDPPTAGATYPGSGPVVIRIDSVTD